VGLKSKDFQYPAPNFTLTGMFRHNLLKSKHSVLCFFEALFIIPGWFDRLVWAFAGWII